MYEDKELEEHLCQTPEELILGVTPQALTSFNIIENDSNTTKLDFLHLLVIGDVKWMNYDNLKKRM